MTDTSDAARLLGSRGGRANTPAQLAQRRAAAKHAGRRPTPPPPGLTGLSIIYDLGLDAQVPPRWRWVARYQDGSTETGALPYQRPRVSKARLIAALPPPLRNAIRLRIVRLKWA